MKTMYCVICLVSLIVAGEDFQAQKKPPKKVYTVDEYGVFRGVARVHFQVVKLLSPDMKTKGLSAAIDKVGSDVEAKLKSSGLFLPKKKRVQPSLVLKILGYRDLEKSFSFLSITLTFHESVIPKRNKDISVLNAVTWASPNYVVSGGKDINVAELDKAIKRLADEFVAGYLKAQL